MSRFLSLGISLTKVVAMATTHPARALGEPERGTLAVGACADVTLFEPVRGSFAFVDGRAGNISHGDLVLRPRMTIRSGKAIPCHESTWAGDDALIAAAHATSNGSGHT